MTLDLAFCRKCGMTMRMPPDYVSFTPWLEAHKKVCPGTAVHAQVRRKKLATGRVTVNERPIADVAREAAEKAAARAAQKAAQKAVQEGVKLAFDFLVGLTKK